MFYFTRLRLPRHNCQIGSQIRTLSFIGFVVQSLPLRKMRFAFHLLLRLWTVSLLSLVVLSEEAANIADSSEPGSKTSNNTTEEQEVPELPDFTYGGIFVYFHLYKTGGTSVNMFFHNLIFEYPEEHNPYHKIIMEVNREDMTKEDVDWSIEQVEQSRQIVFYNFHVEYPNYQYPTLVEAAPVLQQWRAEAEAKGIPFFASTTIREPLGHSLSFFNFFHVSDDGSYWNPFEGDLQPTEANFLKTYVPNRLCHLMYNDAQGILEVPKIALRNETLNNLTEDLLNRRKEATSCDAVKVQEALFGGTFDYVGVTEELSTHSLPMFAKLIFGDASLAADAPREKKAQQVVNSFHDYDYDHNETEVVEVIVLKKEDLSEATKAKIMEESKIDQALYEEARKTFGHWPSFFEPAKPRKFWGQFMNTVLISSY